MIGSFIFCVHHVFEVSSTKVPYCLIDNGRCNVSLNSSAIVLTTQTTTYTITASNPRGTATASVTITVIPLNISITSPLNGETISRPDTMVQGTIINATGNETGVTVNGIVAMVYGNQFVANHVPLGEGEKTIMVSAFDTAGNTATASITVYAQTTGDYIRIMADAESGVSPFETTLKVGGSFTFKEEPNITYNGPGEVEFLDNPEANEYDVRITTPGIYYFTAEVTYDQSNTYTDTIAVVVLDLAQLDALLRAKWNNMKAMLLIRDIDGALAYFSVPSRNEYNEIFRLLSDDLADIVNTMADIELVYIKERVAKYSIEKDEIINGETHRITYYIHFFKNALGLWCIDSF